MHVCSSWVSFYVSSPFSPVSTLLIYIDYGIMVYIFYEAFCISNATLFPRRVKGRERERERERTRGIFWLCMGCNTPSVCIHVSLILPCLSFFRFLLHLKNDQRFYKSYHCDCNLSNNQHYSYFIMDVYLLYYRTCSFKTASLFCKCEYAVVLKILFQH